MILTDAGPLIALIDRGENHHRVCAATLGALKGPMLTTWPAFAEAMYLLGEAGGWRAQGALWGFVVQHDLEIAGQDVDQCARMQSLMQKYQDLPMDLADASLVALAEQQGLRDIFTLDQGDFQVYRLKGRQTLRLWPQSL
jgi:predicted nucleic acid-binding protein